MRTALALLCLACADPAAGAETSIAAGLAVANVASITNLAPALELTVETTGVEGRYRASIAYLGPQDVSSPGWDLTIRPVWIAGAQAIWRPQAGPVTLEIGAGLAYRSNASGIEYLLPSAINVNLSAGVRWGPWRLEARHLSSAWTRDSNRGQNWLQAAWAF